MKVVIISAPIGSGHVKAGQAVGAALQSLDPAVEVVYANVFDFFPAFIGKSILKLYLKILAFFPKAYAMAYSWGNTSQLAVFGRQLISRVLARQMLKYFASVRPDAVVATHATPAGLVAELLRQKQLTVPGIAVVTDFVVHRLWIYPELSYYCVADEALRTVLAGFGIPLERSIACGIPVDGSFAQDNEQPAILHSMQLDPKLPAIMLMAGGEGLLPLHEITMALDKVDMPFQLLIVCGKNHKLYKRLVHVAASAHHPMHVMGFVNNIAELMHASVLLITKPGGLTSAEAMCCGLPLLLYKPIPGQEEANALQLIKKGCAVRADNPEAVVEMVKLLLSNSNKRKSMAQAARAAAKPAAALTAAQLICKLMRT